MPERKAFLLRIDPAVLRALQIWADDDLRSLNGQIEFLLRRALREAGRLKEPKDAGRPSNPNERKGPGPAEAGDSGVRPGGPGG